MRARAEEEAERESTRVTRPSSVFDFKFENSLKTSFQDALGEESENSDYAESKVDPDLDGMFYDALEEIQYYSRDLNLSPLVDKLYPNYNRLTSKTSS